MVHQRAQLRNVPATVLHNALALTLAEPVQCMQAVVGSIKAEGGVHQMAQTEHEIRDPAALHQAAPVLVTLPAMQ